MADDKGRVRFRHVRRMKDVVDKKNGQLVQVVDNMGGATIAYAEVSPGKIQVAMALCAPTDNFNKKTGRAIAGGPVELPKQSMVVDIDWDTFIRSLPYTMTNVDPVF